MKEDAFAVCIRGYNPTVATGEQFLLAKVTQVPGLVLRAAGPVTKIASYAHGMKELSP
jgi:hypothetical protein